MNCAIIFWNICFWIEKNKANDKHFHDGKYWTYNSRRALTVLFPFLTERQIRTALDKLRDDGLIETGNYNDSVYDRTLWYALTEKGEALCHRSQVDVTIKSFESGLNSQISSDQKVQPIPYINTDINTDSISPERSDDHSAQQEVIFSLPLNDGSEYGVTQEDIDRAHSLYPAIDVEQTIREMIGWLDANPMNRKTRSGIKRFMNSWFGKEQNRAKRVQTAPQVQQRETYGKINISEMDG